MCPTHGEFLQSRTHHLSGRGCRKCGRERIVKSHEYNTNEFIRRAIKFHGTKYNYEKTIYTTSKSNVIIICPTHGEFHQNAGNHLRGWGCEKCGLQIFIDCNRWGRKPFVFPDGRVEKIQGYEAHTLAYLISSSVCPTDIIVSGKQKPIIEYELNGKVKRYYPDCYVSSSNTLVETKSKWTWNKDWDKNLAKITGSLNAGYNIRVVIWEDKKHSLISDVTYTK